MRKLITGLVLVLISSFVALEPSSASLLSLQKKPRFVLSATTSVQEVEVGGTFVMRGKIVPKRKNVYLQRQRYIKGEWRSHGGKVKTNARGEYRMTVTAPNTATLLKLRVVASSLKSVQPAARQVQILRPAGEPLPEITLDQVTNNLYAGTDIEVSGTYANPGDTVSFQLEYLLPDQTWQIAPLIGMLHKSGVWRARTKIPTQSGDYLYRVLIKTAGYEMPSEYVLWNVQALPTLIDALGPGLTPRIWGIDVARWQHQTSANGDGLPIDWDKAYAAGIRFAFIKASDGRTSPDQVAARWAREDYAAAKAAGIFTGLYHYPAMPDQSGPSNNPTVLIQDARNEAIQAAARLAELGGYSAWDLPYVLDVESDDIAGSGISTIATKESVTLWVKTWLLEMKARTGRMPIVYGSPAFLQKELVDEPFWDQVPLWIARYSCATDPFTGVCNQITHAAAVERLNAGSTPGIWKTPWSSSTSLDWRFWQYSSRGIGAQFGIQNGAALDMNVFQGSTSDFLSLTQQVWAARAGDYLPTKSAVTVETETVRLKPGVTTQMEVSVERANSLFNPAVSGQLSVTENGVAISGARLTISGVGRWNFELPARAAGHVWNLRLKFTDGFGYYASKTHIVSLTVPSE